LADPAPLLGRLNPAGATRDAVITVVDASTFLHLSAEHRTLVDQVKVADFLVLNKTDLVTDRELRKVEKRLRRLNRRAVQFQATYGQVATDLLFGTGVSTYRARRHETGDGTASPTAASHAHAHGQDAIQAFSYESPWSVDLQAFERFLKKLPSNVYRAKGLLQVTGGAFPHLFNFTCGRFDFQPLAPNLGHQFPTQAVFIGQEIFAVKDKIMRKFHACERPGGTADQ
jgi:G3E family GTPase